MQVDPNPRHARPARSGRAPWGPSAAGFALLPLALGLPPAGLLSACTLGEPAVTAVTAEATRGRETALRPAGGVPVPDPARVVPATLVHAEQGDVDAMVRLALMHETGTADVAQDRAEMLRWLALASALGSGRASYKLSLYYEERPNAATKALQFKQLAQRQGYHGPVSAQHRR